MLAERRPFQLKGLRCMAQTSPTENSYSALVRCSPILTDLCNSSAVIPAPCLRSSWVSPADLAHQQSGQQLTFEVQPLLGPRGRCRTLGHVCTPQ